MSVKTHVGEAIFPAASGRNLQRREVRFPADLDGRLNLLFIAFQQWQQRSVDSWIPFAEQLEAEIEGLVYYELPVIYEMPLLSRIFLNEGMRAGVRDPKARQRTVTLYLDKNAFRAALDLQDEDQIHVLLVDKIGKVLWRARGGYTEEIGKALQGYIVPQASEVHTTP